MCFIIVFGLAFGMMRNRSEHVTEPVGWSNEPWERMSGWMCSPRLGYAWHLEACSLHCDENIDSMLKELFKSSPMISM